MISRLEPNSNNQKSLVNFGLISLFLILGILILLFPSQIEAQVLASENPYQLSGQGVFTIIVLVLTFVALVREVRPPDIIMFISAVVLTVGGALTTEQFLKGFSSDIIMTIAMLCIIVKTLEVNGILNILTKKILPKEAHGARSVLSMTFPVALLSAFLNNTVIVLMMTPIVRKWAVDKKLSPSKYLIPISYASIVGGLCTLIGTSTNVIINGLLNNIDPSIGLGFFELAWVGVPCVIAVLLILSLVVYHLLPVRIDVTSAITQQTSEFTGEFIVQEESPIANKLIKEVSGRYFHGELLVEIERGGYSITAPGPFEVILPNDRLVFAGDIDQIAELHTIKGLKSAADPHFKIDDTSTHFSEVVVSLNSHLIGRTLKQSEFRNTYGASVLAIYRQGKRLTGNIGNIPLDAGDTLILLSSELWPGERFSRDFYLIKFGEKVNIFNPWRTAFIALVLVGMVSLVIMGYPILTAVLAATLLMLFSRSVTIREARRGILWNVLLLIASSFAVATAAEVTGVATFFANILLSIVGSEPIYLVAGILVVTCVFTEILSNNAAALLIFPVATQAAILAGYSDLDSMKTIGIAVAVGASCGFALPTGYQTHMIVYGPGGYRFTDFIKAGLLIDAVVLIVSSLCIPYIWPLR
ncbi:MAG: SLC13 family permease [Chlamydiales bacterium]